MDLSNPTFVIGGLSESCSETVLEFPECLEGSPKV